MTRGTSFAFAVLGLVSLLGTAALGNLPPYTQPGSWLGTETGWMGNHSYQLGIALWDGESGQNYTTFIGYNLTFFSFIPTVAEQVIAYTYGPISQMSINESYLAIYQYSPLHAPTLKAPTCAMPSYAAAAYPFVLRGEIYAFSGNILYSIDNSGKECELTVLAPLPESYSPFCSLSITPEGHVSYIVAETLVQLWFPTDPDANVTITSQSIPSDLAADWLWIMEDPVTGYFYYFATVCCYNMSFWEGTRKAGNQNAPVTWSPMKYWNHLDPGNFMLDTRYEKEYNGPLFCSMDGVFDTYCWTVQSETAWYGPHLMDAFNSESGAASYTFYDSNCTSLGKAKM